MIEERHGEAPLSRSDALRRRSARNQRLLGASLFAFAVVAVMLVTTNAASAASAPLIESESVSNITPTDVTLEAAINPNGLRTHYEFWLMFANCQNPPAEDGVCESISVGRVGEGEIPAGSTGQLVSAQLTNLQPGYSYTFWAVATNSGGETVGEHQKFSAQSASPPAIESESVSHITATDATLEAQINSEGLATEYEFFLQPPEPACLEAEPPCMIPQHEPIRLEGGRLLGSLVGQSVSVDLNSAGVTLAPGATYKYWVSATSAAGNSSGDTQRFTASSEGGVEPLNEPIASTGSQISGASPSPQPSAVRRRHHRRGRRHGVVHRRHRLRSQRHRVKRTG